MTLGGNTEDGSTYHAVHIRRGDFKIFYPQTQISPESLWRDIAPLLNSSRAPVLYVATDEKVEPKSDPMTWRITKHALKTG